MNPNQYGQYNMGYSNASPCYGNPTPTPSCPTVVYPQMPLTQQAGLPGYPPIPQGGLPQGQMGYPCPTAVYPQQGYPQPFNQNQFPGHGLPHMHKLKPTVTPAHPFDPRQDATILRKAMKFMGTDEKAIIQVLTRRTMEQRQRIVIEFKNLCGKNLVAVLKSKTSGRFKDLLAALMTPLPEFYAKELHDAIAGAGTDEGVLVEIICSVSNYEIKAIKQTYDAKYGSLDGDLRGDTSGHFKKLLVALCLGHRSEEPFVDQSKARQDAEALVKAGVGRIGTDESVFNQILCYRSIPQLLAIFKEYQTIAGHDIEKAIQKEFSGDIKKGLITMVKIVRNKPLYFAERLHKSMKGLGTNDCQLIRVMVTRCEVDLGDISDVFETTYKGSLQSWIEDDCSGHYKKCLLGLLGRY